MKKFEVVFERSNGTIGIRDVFSISMNEAIKIFNALYRYRDCVVVSVSEVA